MDANFLKFLALSVALVASSGAAARAADTLRVGKPEATGFDFAILDVGMQEGIYQKHDIEIESFEFGGAGKSHQALVANSIDIELGAGVELAFIVKGSPTKGVAAMAGPPDNMGILVRSDGKFDDPASLKGKRIGISTLGSLTYWLATAFSRQEGWGPDGVIPTPIGSVDAEVAALLSDSVDGIVGPLERAVLLEADGRAKLLVSFGQSVPVFLTHMILASDTVIQNKPDVLRRFLDAWFETVAFMQQDRAESVRITAPIMRLSPELAGKIYDAEMSMYFTDGHFDPKALQIVEQSLIDIGQLKQMPDTSKIITEAFLP